MVEADNTNYLNKAINLQHSAMSTAPVMSKAALAPAPATTSPWSAAWQFGTAPFKAAAEPVKIGVGRWAATGQVLPGVFPGTPFAPSIIDQILRGIVPTTQTMKGGELIQQAQ